jgi:hypothetical protein
VKKKDDISPLQFLLVVLGILGWIVAGCFASMSAYVIVDLPPASGSSAGRTVVQSNTPAGGAVGFGVGGGLCFLGAGVVGVVRRGDDSASPAAGKAPDAEADAASDRPSY